MNDRREDKARCVCVFLQDKAEIKMAAYIVEDTGMEVRSLIVTLT